MSEEKAVVPAKGEKQKKRISRRARKTRRVIITAVVLALIALIWLNWDSVSPVAIMQRIQAAKNGKGVQGEYPLDVAQDQILCLTQVGGVGFAAGRDGCYILGDKYPVFYSYSLSSPAVAVGQLNALIYEKNNTGYGIYSRDGQLFSREADAPIRTAAVARNGIYALVTAPSEYTSLLTICSVTHSVLFTQSISDPNIVLTALSSSAEKAAVLSQSTDNGRICSSLTVYDTVQTEPLLTAEFSGELVLAAKFDRSDRLVLLTDRSLIFYGSDLKIAFRYEYGESLQSFCLTYDGTAALLFDTGNVTAGKRIELLDSTGVLYSVAVSYNAKTVGLDGKAAVYLADGLLIELDAKGAQVGQTECKFSADAVAVSDKYAYYTESGTLRRIELTQPNSFDLHIAAFCCKISPYSFWR